MMLFKRGDTAYAASSWEPDEAVFIPDYNASLNAATILPRAKAVGSGVLDKVLPVVVDGQGKATIYGLPPAMTYAVAAFLLGGGVYYAYKNC